ncbi:MAG TPA: multiheme c-type cytochrome [Pirellulaceae bacterium]|nr:multiheme c-type cytochrome [Pirellulaceae bacterium]
MAILGAILSSGNSSLAGESSATRVDQPAAQLVGMMSCSSASCHGQPVDDAFRTGPARQEFSLWLESDPHSKAAHTLNSPEFRRILAVVSSGRENGPVSAEVYVRCARCHDPQGLTLAGDDPASLMTVPAAARGISCESCHGAAEKWLPDHYRDGVTKEQLTALGMIDTDNVLARARQCAACHVGDETRDMNHDMIAAGHPPLRFELSAYHDLIQHKHWSDAERIEKRQFKAQLWAAGQLATLESMLALSKSRAERALEADGDARSAATWPEFAEFDCLACHQRLRPAKVAGSRAELTTAGKPRWQPWNLALAPRLLKEMPLGDISLATTPADAAAYVDSLHMALKNHALVTSLSSPAERSSPAITVDDMLNLLEHPASGERPTWATACQELLALKAGYLAWRDERRKLMRSADVQTTDAARDDPWSVAFRQELDELTAALRFGSHDFEWPAFDWEGLPRNQRKDVPKYGSLSEIRERIGELAGELKTKSVPLEGGDP